MLPKTSTLKSLSYCKTPLNIPRFGRKSFSYSQDVGISVRAAQSTSAFKQSSPSLTFCFFWCEQGALCSPPPKSNGTAELAKPEPVRRFLRGILWDEPKTAAHRLVSQQIKPTRCRSQTKFPSHMKWRLRWARSDAKPARPPRARTQTPAGNFPETKTISVRVSESGEPSEVWRQRLHPLASPELSAVSAPLPHVLLSPTLTPRLETFLGGEGRINLNISKEKPYWYLIRSSQAQKVWVKRVLMTDNEPEVYLWFTLNKKTNPKPRNSSSLWVVSCFHTSKREWGEVHNQNSQLTEEKFFHCSGSSVSCHSTFCVSILRQQRFCHLKVGSVAGFDPGHHHYFNPQNTRNLVFLARLPLPAMGRDSSTSIKELTETRFVLDSA